MKKSYFRNELTLSLNICCLPIAKWKEFAPIKKGAPIVVIAAHMNGSVELECMYSSADLLSETLYNTQIHGMNYGVCGCESHRIWSLLYKKCTSLWRLLYTTEQTIFQQQQNIYSWKRKNMRKTHAECHLPMYGNIRKTSVGISIKCSYTYSDCVSVSTRVVLPTEKALFYRFIFYHARTRTNTKYSAYNIYVCLPGWNGKNIYTFSPAYRCSHDRAQDLSPSAQSTACVILCVFAYACAMECGFQRWRCWCGGLGFSINIWAWNRLVVLLFFQLPDASGCWRNTSLVVPVGQHIAITSDAGNRKSLPCTHKMLFREGSRTLIFC